MSAGSPVDEMLAAISQYDEEVSDNQFRIAEETEAYRARIAPFHMAIDHAVDDLDKSFEKFFVTADIDVFADWGTAAPLYRAGWNNGRGSRGFMEGFERLVKKQDTYLAPFFGWSCHRDDVLMKNPILRMTVMLPDSPKSVDMDKLARTAEVAQKLFAPMAEVDSEHQLDVEIPWFDEGREAFIEKDSEGKGYSVYPYRHSSIIDFIGTMQEALEYIIRANS